MSKQKIESAVYKDNKWDITITGSGWLWSMKQTKKIHCPQCLGFRVHVKENYIKGGKRYTCLNTDCPTETFIVK